MKNVFRLAATTLTAISVAWLAAAATPAEAYYDGYNYDYGYDYGYDYADGYNYDYAYDYSYDYADGYNYDYAYDYSYDYADGYNYDYADGYNYDYGVDGYSYDYGNNDGYVYNYGTGGNGGPLDGFGYSLVPNTFAGPTVAFDWGNGLNNGGCVGAFCGNNRNNGGCTGSSCNGNNDNDDLQAECTVDDTSIEEGDCVTYRVTTKGGDSPFDYEWSGDTRGEDDGDSSFKVCYPKAGTYEVEVEVTDDDNQKDADSCKVKVENKDDDDDNDFDVECRVSDSTIDEGDCVTYSVRIDGGDSPFEYDWNGDLEGEDDDNEKTIRVCYDDAGDYDVTIVVEDDDGNRESDTCEVEVDNDTRGTNSSSSRSYSNRNDSPNGTLASIDSVYLSQIPYTGPEETAALVAAGLAVIGLGFGAAISLKKRAMRKQTADRVAAFKAANLAKKVRA